MQNNEMNSAIEYFYATIMLLTLGWHKNIRLQMTFYDTEFIPGGSVDI